MNASIRRAPAAEQASTIVGFGRGQGHRLLAQHVLAGPGGRDGPLGVQVVRQRDVDGVDVGIGEQRLVGGVGTVEAQLVGDGLRSARRRGPRWPRPGSRPPAASPGSPSGGRSWPCDSTPHRSIVTSSRRSRPGFGPYTPPPGVDVPELGIGLIGSKLMGRAHSNAWLSAPRFFDLPMTPAMRVAAARTPADLARFRFPLGVGAGHHRLAGPDRRPGHRPHRCHHAQPPPRRAVQRGPRGRPARRVEKPLAGTLTDARRMAEAAARSSAQTFVWYSYRRVPALGLAHRLIAAGAPRPALPRPRRLPAGVGRRRRRCSGGSTPTRPDPGALGDLGAHIVDLARS